MNLFINESKPIFCFRYFHEQQTALWVKYEKNKKCKYNFIIMYRSEVKQI